MSVTIQEIQRIFSRCEVEGDEVFLHGKMSIEIRNLCMEALQAKSPAAGGAVADPFGGRLALNVKHPDCHKAADAFWKYWRENGDTHKHGYYESTWGAINAAIRTVGVVPYNYAHPAPAGERECCGNFDTLADVPECADCPQRQHYLLATPAAPNATPQDQHDETWWAGHAAGFIDGQAAVVAPAPGMDELHAALVKIYDFTTGYGDVAGVVNKIARDALAADEAKNG